jgi:L,D-peptidoglycan transpeptidase YkuD (ErfK/YbiS/YcfS/YnhG family)
MENTDRQSILKKFSAKILEWDTQLDSLKAKAAASSEDMKKEYARAAEDLTKKKSEAEAKMKEFEKSSEDGWEELKNGVEKAVGDLGDAFARAKEKFSK